MTLYRYHLDVSGFNFENFDQVDAAIFKDDVDHHLCVYEKASKTGKYHWQGVLSLKCPKSTIESRIKRCKNNDARRGCYSFTVQKPQKVATYYNYLAKGNGPDQLPDVVRSMFCDDDIHIFHQKYYDHIRTELSLHDDVDKVYHRLSSLWKAGRRERVHLSTFMRSLYKICFSFFIDIAPDGFSYNQVHRLCNKQLSRLDSLSLHDAKTDGFYLMPHIIDMIAETNLRSMPDK